MKKFIATCLMCAFMFAAPAFAAENTARQTLEKTLDQVLTVLDRPDFKTPGKNEAMLQEVKDLIYGICDFEIFSRNTLQAYWRTFNPEQQQRFIDAFSNLLFETYKGKLLEYNGEKILFTGEVPGSNNRLTIHTVIPHSGQDIPVDYRMVNVNGTWKVWDMVIEKNISLVQNYRGQFKEILDKGKKPDYLIDLINKKAAEAKAKNNERHK